MRFIYRREQNTSSSVEIKEVVIEMLKLRKCQMMAVVMAEQTRNNSTKLENLMNNDIEVVAIIYYFIYHLKPLFVTILLMLIYSSKCLLCHNSYQLIMSLSFTLFDFRVRTSPFFLSVIESLPFLQAIKNNDTAEIISLLNNTHMQYTILIIKVANYPRVKQY